MASIWRRIGTAARAGLAVANRVLSKRKRSGPLIEHVKPREPNPFLDLPAELRNRIYEEALISPSRLCLDETKPPSLLMTCRQIREEARSIWYLQNTFEIDVRHCEASQAMQFQRAAWGADCEGTELDIIVWADDHSWSNLMAWCKEIHSGRAAPIEPYDEDPTYKFVDQVIAAHAIAQSHSDQPWDVCLAALSSERPAWNAICSIWEED